LVQHGTPSQWVGWFTPEQVFTGRHHDIAQAKQLALDAGYQNHPERFVKGRSIVSMPPKTVAINPILAGCFLGYKYLS
jgi:putative transposase